MDDGLNRFTTNFSDILQQQNHQIQEKISSFSTTLEGFSDRLSGVISSLSGVISSLSGGGHAGTGPAMAGGVQPVRIVNEWNQPASGGPVLSIARGTREESRVSGVVSSLSGMTSTGTSPAIVGGVQLVQVINDQSQPIPIRMLEGAREENKGGGFLSSILGGIGSFFGGIFSGFFAPITGVVVGAELIVALREATPLVREARELVADVRIFGLELVNSIGKLIFDLFGEFYSAGIFPVSKLIASLLILIDSGITLILTNIKPVIDWVAQLLGVLTVWLGNFINSLTQWIESVVNNLSSFLRNTVQDMVRDIIRSLVESLTTVISGLLIGLGKVIIESFTWGVEWYAFSISTMLNKLAKLEAFFSGRPYVEREAKRPEPFGERVTKAVKESIKEARQFGQILAEELLEPEPGKRPKFHLEPPKVGKPKIPGFPSPEPGIEEILKPPRRGTSLTPGVILANMSEAAPEATSPITINGGINVQITAQTIDRENVEETARLIAENVLNEIQHLTEQDRFRRGLPTRSIV